ncbi:MAG: glycosyltransferase family 9 protein [Thermodesulforhabdaceae bacterium]
METPRTLTHSPPKILIIKLSALGDIAHALPVVDYIKHHLPDAEVDWVVEERFRELLATSSMIRKIYAVDTRKLRRRLLSQEAGRFIQTLRRDMKSRRYDVALDLQGNIKSAIFTMLSSAPYRYGFSSGEVREFPNIFATNRKVSTSSVRNIRSKLLTIAAKFLKDSGMTTTTIETHLSKPLRYMIDANEQERQKQFLMAQGWQGEHIIGMVPGTTWQTKMWHPGRWLEFIELVQAKNLGRILIFWGNAEEQKFSRDLVSLHLARVPRTKANHLPTVWNGGDIRALIAALSLVKVVVGPDTGPVHIAALIGTPTVSFYRATEATRNAPAGEFHFACQSPLPCSPCFKKTCPDNNTCSASIKAGDVVNGLEKLLAMTREQ